MFGMMIDFGQTILRTRASTPFLTSSQGHGLVIFMLKNVQPQASCPDVLSDDRSYSVSYFAAM